MLFSLNQVADKLRATIQKKKEKKACQASPAVHIFRNTDASAAAASKRHAFHDADKMAAQEYEAYFARKHGGGKTRVRGAPRSAIPAVKKKGWRAGNDAII